MPGKETVDAMLVRKGREAVMREVVDEVKLRWSVICTAGADGEPAFDPMYGDKWVMQIIKPSRLLGYFCLRDFMDLFGDELRGLWQERADEAYGVWQAARRYDARHVEGEEEEVF